MKKQLELMRMWNVNYISSGALTHSVYNMDLSLKAI
jgi:nicotinate-nucleotide pyrophosphorylase